MHLPGFRKLGLVILLVALPAHVAGDDAEIDRLVAVVRGDDDPAAWARAVRELRAIGAEARERLDRTLAVLLVEKHRALEAAARPIRGLVARMPGGKAVDRRLARWDETRERAREWIFSEKTFPEIDGPIFGPEEGYDEAMARGRAAVEAYRGLARALGRAVGPLSRLDAGEARALRDAYGDARRARDRVAAEVEGSRAPPVPEIPPLAWVLLDIREGRYRGVAERFRGLPPGWPRLLVFEAYGRALLERNAREPCGQSSVAVRALADLNAYRMALGISPLAHNARLVEMARKHSREMTRLGYLGHESPVPENRTMRDRARNAGYRGWVEECISGRSSPATAVETWKWDGGHHRIMVRETHAEVGLGDRGPCVLNAGSGEPDCPPVIRY